MLPHQHPDTAARTAWGEAGGDGLPGMQAVLNAIVNGTSLVLGLIEKYGPEAWTTIETAVEDTVSSGGPTTADIEAIYAGCKADNAAIQAS